MSDELEKAAIRERRLQPFGRAGRNGGLGMLRPNVLDFFPNTLRGHGLASRASHRIQTPNGSVEVPYKQLSCVEPSCIFNRPKGTAHSDRGRNVDEWLDLVGA